MAGRALEEHIKHHLKVGLGETTADKKVTFEAVYCLGLCACAPSMMIDGKLHGRVTPEKFDRIMAKTAAGAR
jgi:formate dehydrogenase subunit gamma